MTNTLSARLSLLAAMACATPALAAGDAGLTGVVLTGAAIGARDRPASGPGARTAPSPSALTPGIRVQGGSGSWTEVALSDGSSIVLARGAGFTLRSVFREEGRRVMTAAGDGGRIQVAASDGLEVRLRTAGSEVRVSSGTAVVDTGPGGAVTLLSGGPVTVVRGGREDTLRRPGFAMDLATGETRRQTRLQLVQDVDSFAPVSDGAISAATAQRAAQDQATAASTKSDADTGRTTRTATSSAGGGSSSTSPRNDAVQSTTATATVASAPAASISTTAGTSTVSVTATPATTGNPNAVIDAANLTTPPQTGTPQTQRQITLGTDQFVLGDNITNGDVAAPGSTTSVKLDAPRGTPLSGTASSGTSSSGTSTSSSTRRVAADTIISAVTNSYRSASGTVQSYSVSNKSGSATGLALAYAPPQTSNISSVPLFVIDGQASSSAGARFFVVGGAPLTGAPGSSLPGQAIGTVARFAITDGLAAGGAAAAQGLQAGRTIASQYPGALAFSGLTSLSPIPSLLAQKGSVPAAADSGLLVVSDPARNNPALRSELQIAADGRSAASVTVGGVYASTAGGNLALNGRLVGSGQLSTGTLPVAYTTSVGSPGVVGSSGEITQAVFASSAGGPVAGFAVQGASSSVSAVGAPGAVPFTGYTRLATNVGSGAAEPTGQLNLTGYASAVVVSSNGQSQLYAVGTDGAGVRITGPATGSALYATLDLKATGIGSLPGSAQTVAPPAGISPPSAPLTFGTSNYTVSGTPQTAVASLATFAAVGSGAALASVNQDMLAKLAAGLPAAANLPASNQHVAWGYFLGDLADQANQASGNYANLGFWVAGQQVPKEALATLTGTATYSGGMIGTVTSGGGTATRAGSFTQNWNFGAQTATMNASFDGASWNGVNLKLQPGTATYLGSGATADAARTLSVNGGFFNNPATATTAPAATGGIFGIQGANGAYGANGIFVGARRP